MVSAELSASWYNALTCDLPQVYAKRGLGEPPSSPLQIYFILAGTAGDLTLVAAGFALVTFLASPPTPDAAETRAGASSGQLVLGGGRSLGLLRVFLHWFGSLQEEKGREAGLRGWSEKGPLIGRLDKEPTFRLPYSLERRYT